MAMKVTEFIHEYKDGFCESDYRFSYEHIGYPCIFLSFIVEY